MKKTRTRILCLILCLLFAVPMSISASTIDEIKEKQEELRQQEEDLQEKLDKLKADEADAKEYQETLVQKIDLLKERIDNANTDITKLNKSISDLEIKLGEYAKEYEATLVLLAARIKAVYKAGEISTLEMLLNSTSLYDFSLRTVALDVVAEHDQKLMDEINEYIEITKADRERLNAEKAEVANLKKQLEVDKKDLEDLSQENIILILALEENAQLTQDEIGDLKEQDAEYQAEIDRLIEEQRIKEEEERKAYEEWLAQQEGNQGGGNTDVDNGINGSGGGGSSGFYAAWPVPGYSNSSISWYYNPGAGHYGLDIAAPYGTPIVAAEAGQVLSAESHWSWGENVLIYHNGTYSTRYAHMSTMAVSAGEYVQKGQVIGYIGSTGYSFGNHLHFEVYQNGWRVDPYPFL